MSASAEAVLNAGITQEGVKFKPENVAKSPPKKRGRPPKSQQQPSVGSIPARVRDTFNKDLKAKIVGEFDDLDKDATMRKIQGFYDFFPDIPINPSISHKSSKQDLAGELDRVRKFRRRGQALNNIKRLDLLATYGAEFGLLNMGYTDVRGLTAVAAQSQDVIEDVLTELAIEYEDYLTQGPLMLYMLHFVERVNKTIQINRAYSGRDSATQASTPPVPPNTPAEPNYAEKYNKL